MTLMVPLTLYGTGLVWFPLLWIVFMSYMTLIVSPYLIWNRYCMAPPHVHMVPLTLYETGIILSPTCMVAHMWSVFMLYMTLMVPHTLYGQGIIWFPLHTCMVPHMWSLFMSNMTIMVPPYLIWNRYHMVPHMYDMIFFKTALKEVHCLS